MKKLSLSLKAESLSIWITDKYIYLMLFVFPLFTGFKGYSQITLSKYIFFVSITSLWLIVMLIDNIKTKHITRFKHKDFITLFIFLYIFACCLSAAFSSFKSIVIIGNGRFDGLATIFLYVCIFLGIRRYSRPKLSYLYAVSASMSLNCIIAILQIMGYNPLHLFPGDYSYYDAGVKFSSVFLGTIGNADLYSAFLCLGLPLIFVYYITAIRRHFILLPAIALSAFCLFSCGVSGGILAAAVCTVVSAPFMITNNERLRRALEVSALVSLSVLFAVSLNVGKTAELTYFDFFNIKTYLFLALSISLILLRLISSRIKLSCKYLKISVSVLSISTVALGFVAIYFWKGNSGTIYEISQVLHGNVEESFGSSRVLIWRETLKLVPEKLWLGGGPGTLPERLDLNFSRFVEETGKTLQSSVDNAHNDYLGILVNTGLLSLVLYLSAQFISLIKTAKASNVQGFYSCLACSLLCYWVQAFFGLGLFLVTPMMWLIWGLLVSALNFKPDIVTTEPAAEV